MTLKIFVVYDSKVEAYLKPFYVQSKGEAIRAFSELANDKTTNFGKYPADFTLFEIGSFDSETGDIQQTHVKHNWGTALEHRSPEQPAAFQQPVTLPPPSIQQVSNA